MVGATPRIHGSRGTEIAVWLRGAGDVARYVVLDDDRDASDGHEGRFVHVRDGLEAEHVAAAVQILSTGAPLSKMTRDAHRRHS